MTLEHDLDGHIPIKPIYRSKPSVFGKWGRGGLNNTLDFIIKY